jgi:Raf kinase inhibitor-like YbhB/YbcL family protein
LSFTIYRLLYLQTLGFSIAKREKLGKMRKPYLAALIAPLLVFFLSPSVAAQGSSHLDLKSGAFAVNSTIPSVYTCQGDDVSPALSWTGVPSRTKTLALIVKDPDAPNGNFVHWVLYNLPATETHLERNVPKERTLASGAAQGLNGFMKNGYMGPCPPPGKPHHYHFRLYALDIQITGLNPGDATADDVERAARGHVVASADLVGLYER